MLPSHGMEVALGTSFGPDLRMILAELSTGPCALSTATSPALVAPVASLQHLNTQEGGCSCGCGFLIVLFQGYHPPPEGCDGGRLRASRGFLVPAL